MKTIALFSDESCHIRNDGYDHMTLATIYVSKSSTQLINKDIRNMKLSFGFDPNTELKWTKVSPGNLEHYKKIIDYIFDLSKKKHLRIRTLVAKNKSKLLTDGFDLSYNDWYHAMYYYLFRKIVHDLRNDNPFYLFIDKKDSNSPKNTHKLADYLSAFTLWDKKIIPVVSDSKEHQLIQVADIIAGACSYKNRDLKTSSAKIALVKYIESSFGVNLSKTSKFEDVVFNNFVWRGKHVK